MATSKQIVPVGDMPSYNFQEFPELVTMGKGDMAKVRDWWWRCREVLRRMDEKIRAIELQVTNITNVVNQYFTTIGYATQISNVMVNAVNQRRTTITASTPASGGTTVVVVGPQGPQGPQGPKGDTGATGPQGPAGPINIRLKAPLYALGPLGEVLPGILIYGSTLKIGRATSVTDGYLTHTDWTTFYEKDRFYNADLSKSWKMMVIEVEGADPTGKFYDERVET